MVEELKNIYFIDKKFTLVQRKSDRLIYQNIDKDLDKIYILELFFSKELEKIKKIDVYTIEDEDVIESLHIIRGVDGITEIDYYPQNEQYLNIDGNKELYNINIYKTYCEENDNIYSEMYELELVKKGHKKHKFLSAVPLSNTLYITQNNRIHRITSLCISKFNQLTQFIIPSVNEIEKNLFEPNEKEVIEEKVVNDEELIEEAMENYPSCLYIYDRNYQLVGIKNKAIIYRNTEDNIMELEIYFNNKKDKIAEIRFIEYKELELEGIKTKSKKTIVRAVSTENHKIKANLCNRVKEPMILNNHTIEKTLLKATAIISETNKIEEMYLDIQSQLGNFNLTRSHNIGTEFIDKNNEEYNLSSNSYMLFRMLILYIPAIIKNLEKELIYLPRQEEKEKILLIKN